MFTDVCACDIRREEVNEACRCACPDGIARLKLAQAMTRVMTTTPTFVSMQCEEQSLESAETTTHHLGKPLVLIYEA